MALEICHRFPLSLVPPLSVISLCITWYSTLLLHAGRLSGPGTTAGKEGKVDKILSQLSLGSEDQYRHTPEQSGTRYLSMALKEKNQNSSGILTCASP